VRRRLVGLSLIVFLIDASASAATITFSSLSLNDVPFNGYSESGFDVTPTLGSWVTSVGGVPKRASIIFRRLQGDPPVTSAVAVTAAGLPFTFDSVDLYSSVTRVPYTFTGFWKSSPVFAISGELPNIFGNYVTVSGDPTEVVDRLLIQLTNPVVRIGNPMGLDNIVVTLAPPPDPDVSEVPEPSTAVLVMTGVAAAGWRYRRTSTRAGRVS
jgi:hypothetical protein